MEVLTSNLGTLITALVLIAIVAAIIFSMRKDKKAGKSSCGGDCAHCGGCHARRENAQTQKH